LQLISQEEFDELYNPPQCSAAWRGYQGTWKILGELLYLSFLERDPCRLTTDSRKWKEKQFDFEKIIPGENYGIKLILADWYTGDITIPLGEFKVIEKNGKKELFYQIIVYKISKGKVISREIKYASDKSVSNKIKNVNASKAGSDTARKRRPFQRR